MDFERRDDKLEPYRHQLEQLVQAVADENPLSIETVLQLLVQTLPTWLKTVRVQYHPTIHSMNFERRGRVTKVEPLAGSFCQATVENADGSIIHTLGFSQQLEHPPWPKVGDMVVVKGVIRNGRYLTSDWRRAT